jgi:hypothetical protein
MNVMTVPNGQGGVTIMPDYNPAADAPSTYEGRYIASDVKVSVTYHTGNKAIVDSLEKNLIDSGWTFDQESGLPSTPFGWWTTGLILSTFVGLVGLAILVFGAILANIGEFISFNQLNNFITASVRYDIIGYLAFNGLMTIYLIFATIKQRFK